MKPQAIAPVPMGQKLPLYLLIAALPFSDFLQTGVVAFNAAPVASAALALRDWRTAFCALLVPAMLLAALAAWTLDDRRPGDEALSQSHPAGLLILLGGSFLLLHAFQRSGFDFFVDPATPGVDSALALPALWFFMRLDGRRARPLIRFGDLAQRRYLLGLGMFGICYVVLGANSMVLPVLLQRALGLPLDVIGRYLGMGALAGVASWIVLSRLLPRSPGPTRYYFIGFSALLLCGWQLTRLSETANPMHSVVPALLCNGAFVIVVLSTTAMQTFQNLQRDDTSFSHANQVKNIVAQFGVAAGVALATLCMQWRSSVRYTRLSESLSPENPAVQQTLDRLTRYFESTPDAANAPHLAMAQLGWQTAQEATFMAALDYFQAVMAVAMACLVLVLLTRALRKP